MAVDAAAVLKQAAQRTLRYDFTVWFWGDAIALDGLLEADELLGDKKFAEFCGRYLERWAKAVPSWTDYLTPGKALIRLNERVPQLQLGSAAERLMRWYTEETPRGPDGVHYFRPDLPQFRTTVLVDSMYHVPSFFAQLGASTGDEAHFRSAIETWVSHAAALTGPRGPLLFHNYDVGSGRYRGYGWGRGNGWALLGLADVLELLPESHPQRTDLVKRFETLSRLVFDLQDRSGFWRTLLDEKEAYLESSTAAFYGAAFMKGVRLGFLDERYAGSYERAWTAMLSRIDADGGFFGVSGVTWASTAASEDLTLYQAMPTEVNVWGQGAAMRFAAERIRAGLN
ncbi:glycoside hydrolase family 88 protein [Rhodospirillaceae bacterium SYSU D60014]|uniref:glycoside hydrolase family 88 protein n=1 Tax=Virgifigura deserti TaxID=2268457 RepID=UPI000E66AF99